MGRKGSWFSAVKKAISPDPKKKIAKKSKKKWFGKDKPSAPDSPNQETIEVSQPHPLPPLEDENFAEVETEQEKHACSVDVSTSAAAEVAVAAAHAEAEAEAEAVQLTPVTQFEGKSEEDVAAIRIQTAFRGYLARRALRALRGLIRLKTLIDGPTVKRQTSNTLKCMQTMSRVQSQIQSRRIRMLEENKALQRQILQKHAKELESLRMGEEWDDSTQSKEQVEANLLHKYEAAMRRERALAYSYTHQQTWKKSARSTNLLFMDPTNPQWGWSWLERRMAGRPWETQSTADKDLNSDRLSLKSASLPTPIGEITRSFARHQLNSENPSSLASQKPPLSVPQSPATPHSKMAPSRKFNTASPRGSAINQDDDAVSSFSMRSERNRRHSIGGLTIRDDESLASSPSVPSYMAQTQSTKVKSRIPSPLGVGIGNMPPEKGPVGSTAAKKRLSYPHSPARPRRHSGPPKVETSSIVENDANAVLIN